MNKKESKNNQKQKGSKNYKSFTNMTSKERK